MLQTGGDSPRHYSGTKSRATSRIKPKATAARNPPVINLGDLARDFDDKSR